MRSGNRTDELRAETAELRAEIARLRPIVDATCRYFAITADDDLGEGRRRFEVMRDLARAYTAGEGNR